MGITLLRRCTTLAPLVALALVLVPAPASAQSAYPACEDRLPQYKEPTRDRLDKAAKEVVQDLIEPTSGAIRDAPGTTLVQPTNGNHAAFGLLEAGGEYCRHVGRWLDWQLNHLETAPGASEGAIFDWRVVSKDDETKTGVRGFDNRNGGLLTLARYYQHRAYGGVAWLNTGDRLAKVTKAAEYLDRLYEPLPVGGLTQMSESGNWATAKYFQDNVASWAGYRDYVELLGKYGLDATHYAARAESIRDATEAYLYDSTTGSYRNHYGNPLPAPMGFDCFYPGAYGNTMPLWLGIWGTHAGLLEAYARRGALFTKFISPVNQLGWTIRDLPAKGTTCDDSIHPHPSVAVAAVRASTDAAADGGGLHHQATALVYETNLREIPFTDPEWDAINLGSYMRYLGRVGVYALQDDADAAGTSTTGNWRADSPAAEDPPKADNRSDIHAGAKFSYTDLAADGPATMTFAPDIPQRGWYSVRLVYQSRGASSAMAVPVTVQHHTGGATVRSEHLVNQRNHMSNHTTHKVGGLYCLDPGRDANEATGQWVRISNAGTAGRVSADAVVLQRTGDC